MATFRWVQNSIDQNKGFSEAELHQLETIFGFSLPTILTQYLKNAGKFSNALGGEPIDITDLFTWNQDKSILSQLTPTKIQQPFCFFSLEKKNEDTTSGYFPTNADETFLYYYFVDLSKKELPVYSFSESEHFIEPQPGYVQLAPIGLQLVSPSLIQFINRETEKKYGETTGKKIANIIGVLVFSPLLILLVLYLIIQPNSSWRSTLFFWKKTN